LTSITKQAIGNENYQTKLINNGITKVNVSSDYTYRIFNKLSESQSHALAL
jgi:hypothetical protein